MKNILFIGLILSYFLLNSSKLNQNRTKKGKFGQNRTFYDLTKDYLKYLF